MCSVKALQISSIALWINLILLNIKTLLIRVFPEASYETNAFISVSTSVFQVNWLSHCESIPQKFDNLLFISHMKQKYQNLICEDLLLFSKLNIFVCCSVGQTKQAEILDSGIFQFSFSQFLTFYFQMINWSIKESNLHNDENNY